MESIQYISYRDIDKIKWDACIDASANGLIYSYSFYLDTMSKHWDALVLNDYEVVMPLTWNKKFGIYYLYQPPFTASLGIFGNSISAEIINAFLKAIPKKFSYWDIYLNHGNYFQLADFNLYQRMNYILPLNNSYENIYNGYRKNIQRNIKKCEQLQCIIKKEVLVEDVIALSNEHSRSFSKLGIDDFERVKKIYTLLYQTKKAITYGVYQNKKLLASAAFFFSHGRAYYILIGNHPDGKTIGASHALIDAFIKDHANQNLILDFEGSDITNLAFFYSSFGALEEKYTGIILNRLPALIKWLK
ncbi:MAG: hypothetical protein WCG67_06055 [Ferruginibacter sp.]